MENELNPKTNWLKKRTKLEKILIVVFGLVCLFCIYLITRTSAKQPEENSTGICTTKTCVTAASRILAKIDTRVNPCDDFYQFACGKFLENALIPDDKTSLTGFSDLDEHVLLQLGNIFEEPFKDNDTKPLKLMKILQKSCLNISRIEQDSIAHHKKLFKNLGGWPVIDTHWNEKNFEWKKLLYNMRKIGLRQNFFISLSVSPSSKDSSKYMLWVTQPSIDNKWYRKGFNNTYVKATYDYMVDVATNFGAERKRAISEMREVIEFKIKLARITIPYEERKNASLEHNPMTIKELQKEYPSIPWLQFINVYLAPHQIMTSNEVVNVQFPKFLENVEDLLLKTSKRVLANYMFYHTLSSRYFPLKIKSRYLEYEKIIYGNSEGQPRWKECIQSNSWLFRVATSHFYIKRYFNKRSKKRVEELFLDIRSAFFERLNEIDWMDIKTKQGALLKAKDITASIGYPESLLDGEEIKKYYESLELDGKEFLLELDLNISLFSHMHHVKNLRKPVIKNDWRDNADSYMVNGFYDNVENNIRLPAAVLQGDFYNVHRPNVMNYATIGEIIGHEFIHGFDDNGRQYDNVGNLINWWQPKTAKTYKENAQCFVKQYSNYSLKEIDMKLNGVKNLDENIADNGGIKLAYRALEKWLIRNGEEQILPALNFTTRQMFWLSTATTWCGKYRAPALKNLVLNGFHAPAYYRILVPFSNSKYFAEDFNCQLGTNMNPLNKCEVW